MPAQIKEIILTFAALLAFVVLTLCAAGCAPETFSENGIIFTPVPRAVIDADVEHYHMQHDYRVDAVAFPEAHTVLYADDTVMTDALKKHEEKHFRRDPKSPTGFCLHQPDGETWIDDICQ